jgi:hypothetical protein
MHREPTPAKTTRLVLTNERAEYSISVFDAGLAAGFFWVSKCNRTGDHLPGRD